MTDFWLCVNCEAIVQLDQHGRCSVCNSDAVVRRALGHLALVARLWPEELKQIEELEQLWRK
jgi:hypothetical protein